MADRIAGKKLDELGRMLGAKKIEWSVSGGARELLRKKGISEEYGARELERVIGSEIKPLLVDEILFGRLKKGGSCRLSCREDTFMLEYQKREKPCQCTA